MGEITRCFGLLIVLGRFVDGVGWVSVLGYE